MIFGLTLPERLAMGLHVTLGHYLRKAGDGCLSFSVEAVKRKRKR